MSKLRTALSLLAAGDFPLLRRRLRVHVRRRALRRRPFAYRLHGFPQYSLRDGEHLPLRPLRADETFADARSYNLVAVPRAHPRAAALLASLAP